MSGGKRGIYNKEMRNRALFGLRLFGKKEEWDKMKEDFAHTPVQPVSRPAEGPVLRRNPKKKNTLAVKPRICAIHILFLLIISAAYCDYSFAQEKEGFVKRTLGRLSEVFKRPKIEESARPMPEPKPISTLPDTKPVSEAPVSPEMPMPVPEREPVSLPEKVTEGEMGTTAEAEKTTAAETGTEGVAETAPEGAFDGLAEGEGESIFGRTDQIPPEQSPLFDFTEEDIIQRIKEEVKFWEAALSHIPEIKVTLDEEGNVAKVEYMIDGVLKNIEELDKETLIRINNTITHKFSQILSDRLRAQWKATALALSVPKLPETPVAHTPPSLPQVYIPPSPPKVPDPTPQAHQAPTLPPTPPTPPQNR
ncbi:MAG: hypothetical protein A2Z72_03590 [Omnitrophica bacterium RBG_13_46_9]|nr:MAG: hypothetical protein A2Z72_03590 [Omnitrophica bacterium RBG_13_46_9]